jgi:hypothetical protein
MRNAFAAALVLGALAFAVRAETVHFTAKLDGASETPPNTSAGSGEASVDLDRTAKTLTWTITYKGLSGPATMAHFHGPAAAGKAAGVQIPLTGDMASPMKGEAPVSDGQIGDLDAGLWYVNVHTAKDPAGEIRGQLTQAK